MKDKKDIYLKILQKESPALYNASVATLSEGHPSNTIFTTTALAVAPLLFTFVMWVIEEAKKNNIERLYFLARDGYIMKEIATRICDYSKTDIECKYLYCSRIAWRIPQYHLEKEKCLDKICINSVEVNIDKILDRASLTSTEKEEVYKTLKINELERKRHLQWYEVLEYKEKLSNCNKFMQYVYEHSEKAYEATKGYLEQEGLFEKIKYAVVDTGWTGSMQTSLSCLLNGKKIEGFYFGMYNLPYEADQENFHSFYFSKKKHIKNKVYFNNNLFECLCSSPDGMTVGYEQSENRYVPVFARKRNINIGSWDIELHINTIIRFTQFAVLQDNIFKYNHKISRKLSYMLCKEFMVYPSVQEAECYGDFIFSDDVTEYNINKLAADMTLEEIKQNFLIWRLANRFKIKNYDIPYKQSCWIDASIIKCKSINGKKYLWNVLLFRWVQYIYMRISRK